MMLRKRMVLLAMLLSGICHLVVGNLLLRERETDNSASHEVSQYTRYRAYTVGKDDWLEFQFGASSRALRLFTNAALAHDVHRYPVPEDVNARLGYCYCLEYQLLDWRGLVLKESEYYFRASLPKSDDLGEEPLESFFAKNDLIPAGTRTMQIPMIRYADTKPARLRVRLVKSDPLIEEVVVRMYVEHERAGYDKPATWQRLSKNSRDKITRASVFPAELLSRQEKSNLLRWKWQAASPVGFDGREFHMRRMYVASDRHQPLSDHSVEGVEIHAEHRMVAPLPNQLGQVVLHIAETSGQETEECLVRWYGPTRGEREERFYRIGASPIHLPEKEGGLLEISTNVTATARLLWHAANTDAEQASEPMDITPTPVSARMYCVSDEVPLDFAIAHAGEKATPLRITLRGDMSGKESPPIRSVRWQFLDMEERVIHSGDCRLPLSMSLYDQLYSNSEYVSVSDAQKVYFRVPPEAVTLRLTSLSPGVLAAAATRSPYHPKRTLVPEDYDLFERRNLTRKSWFAIRPRGYDKIVAGVGSVTCHLQSRPRTQVPGDGRGGLEYFSPQKLAISRELLTERATNQPLPAEAAAIGFVEVGHEIISGRWIEPPGKRVFQPKLIYQVQDKNTENESPKLRMLVDGKVVMQRRLRSRTGEIELPRIRVSDLRRSGKDVHLFHFQTPANVRVFVSHLDVPAARQFIKRTGHALQQQMEFIVNKESPSEQLVLRVFQTSEHHEPQERLKLRVRIGKLGVNRKAVTAVEQTIRPTASQTLMHRQFEIAQTEVGGSVILGAEAASCGRGESCYIQLGEDLPEGRYLVKVASQGKGYLSVFRRLEKASPKRSLFKEYLDE